MTFKERLLEFNRRGLVHAPDESDNHFFCRCRKATATDTSPSSSLARTLFDIDPDWVWIVYDNKGLHFWEGGCTWTQNFDVKLQLHKAFLKKSSYLGYSREEIVAHELVHVVRSHFEEPIFEEILAYHTSASSFRRFFAPLFRTAKESVFFMASLGAFFVAMCFGLFEKVALGGVFCLLAGGSCRLLWAQIVFSRTYKKLAKLVGKDKALAVMLRLTDREIIRFAKMDLNAIQAYAHKMAKIQMRWQQITGAYFA